MRIGRLRERPRVDGVPRVLRDGERPLEQRRIEEHRPALHHLASKKPQEGGGGHSRKSNVLPRTHPPPEPEPKRPDVLADLPAAVEPSRGIEGFGVREVGGVAVHGPVASVVNGKRREKWGGVPDVAYERGSLGDEVIFPYEVFRRFMRKACTLRGECTREMAP